MSSDQDNSVTNTATELPTPSDFKAGFEYLRPHLLKIPEADLDQFPLEGAFVVQTLLGTYQKILAYREEILLECPRLDPNIFPNFRLAVFALAHAEVLKRAASGLPSDEEDPIERVRNTRSTMKADLEPLLARGLLTPGALALSQGNSPRAIAFDVLRLATYIDQHSTLLQGRMWTTPEEVSLARAAAQQLLEFAGGKDQTNAEKEASRMYQRAFTHVAELYDELRWAVRYTRRKVGDAELIAPSLYSMRAPRGSSKRSPAEGSSPNAAPTPSPEATEVTGVDLDHVNAIMNGLPTQAEPLATNEAAEGPAPVRGAIDAT